MPLDRILVRGAREHNLKNLDIELPRDQLVVITGLSGSGKSSLAFDTIYAEGQRRYVESLSSYARQFLGQMDKPDVDYIEGLSPAISIDQKGTSRNPRSTVGTVTEIYDYLRLLYARIGHPHCPNCGRAIQPQTIDQMVDLVLSKPEGTKVMILAPLIRGRKGQYQKLFREIRDKGFTRARVDGELVRVDEGEDVALERYVQHTIEVVVDRISVRPGARQRVAESLETTLGLSGGTALVAEVDGPEQLYSQHLACVECGLSFAELAPRLFSFNSPFGACPKCTGLGFMPEIDPTLVVPDPTLSVSQGAIAPWGKPLQSFRHHPRESWFWRRVERVADKIGIDLDVPWKRMPEEHRRILLHGGKSEAGGVVAYDFEGALPILERRYSETESDWFREEIEKFMTAKACPECQGGRLKPEARAVTVNDLGIAQFTALPVRRAREWTEGLELTEREMHIGRQILKEIRARLRFLDEPSVGLHQRDNRRLLDTLFSLRNLGNTLLVVEHDEDTIREADHVVDMGPGAGIHGGHVVAQGTPAEIAAHPDSITGAYLSGRLQIPLPERRRRPHGDWIELKGCRQNNLQDLDVRFPLGLFNCVTGVSGSGKSTLVNEILYRALALALRSGSEKPGEFREILGVEHLDKVIIIDQTAIGRTPRSNPATYTGLFDPIRQIFAQTPEARLRGYAPGRFSFNVKGGRCEACQGQGILKIEMHFLPDVFIPCEVCKGKRYNRETLEVHFKGKNIAEVLDMTVEEGLEIFEHLPRIARKLETLRDVGLGYVHLGQAATTLSGGEAQRVKLATELSRRATGRTVYLLDEPTTGLHFADVAHLLEVLHRLVKTGNTIIVIEHNLDIIKSADWIVDLGPEGGDRGGQVVVAGPPEVVAAHPDSWTGRYLRPVLERHGIFVEVPEPPPATPKRATRKRKEPAAR